MSWKKEVLRDLETMGSFVFYAIVASRSVVGNDWDFLAQMGIALGISLVLWQSIKYLTDIRASSHASNAVIMMILVNAFYKDLLFGILTIFLFGMVFYAHYTIRKHKPKPFWIGALIGLVSGGIMWWTLG